MNLAQTSLSFSGCGFLCLYHAGVAAAVKEYAPRLQRNKMAGASAGSLAAAGLICNVCMSKATSIILNVVTQARSRALGALHPAFNLIGVMQAQLEKVLPPDAHVLCSGKLHISLTRERDHKNVVVSQFDSKQELIQAILCSCFIPYYCGRTPPEFRGEKYLDGGWSDNQPVIDHDSITVSPFSGESDICPPDFDSAGLFGFDFGGTSIRFTARNMYRLTVCLIPPSTEVCSRICRQGFEDAVRFLTRNGVVPCTRCLAVQSNLVEIPLCNTAEPLKLRSLRKLTTVASRRRLDSECINSCVDNSSAMQDVPSSHLFPLIMQKIFDEALEVENRWLGYFGSFRVVRWLQTAIAHIKLPFEIIYVMCNNIAEWLASLERSDWVSRRLEMMLRLVVGELDKQRAIFSARLSYQMAITELELSSDPRHHESNEHVLDITLSPEAQLELDALRRRDQLRSCKNLVDDAQHETTREDTLPSSEEWGDVDNLDALNHVIEYAKAHDAILAYYYTDDNDKVRICEVFDVRHPDKRHRCHSHLVRTANEMDSTQDPCTSEAPPSSVKFTCDQDSGLSMAEEGYDSMADSSVQDACCSPVKQLVRSSSWRPSNSRLHRNWSRRSMNAPTIAKRRPAPVINVTAPVTAPVSQPSPVFSSDSDVESDDKLFAPRRARGTSEEYDGETEQ